jgi:hypothetical protein
MQQLNFPAYEFKVKTEKQKTQIFDAVRKKYVALTPEEWVRQHIIAFLIAEKQFPASLIAVEVSLNRGSKKQRGDVVVYTNDGKPRMIIECKAPEVKITQDVFFSDCTLQCSFKNELPCCYKWHHTFLLQDGLQKRGAYFY